MFKDNKITCEELASASDLVVEMVEKYHFVRQLITSNTLTMEQLEQIDDSTFLKISKSFMQEYLTDFIGGKSLNLFDSINKVNFANKDSAFINKCLLVLCTIETPELLKKNLKVGNTRPDRCLERGNDCRV